MTQAVIFVGPSLPPALRPADPRLKWRDPVRQVELYRTALTRPAIIGVIDGYFEITPTVWHKEILWAMAQGIHVYGGASIGALRAAELHPFGMKGIGRIFTSYRDGILTDDDEVAVLHAPEQLGYVAVTEAMVNIRATLDRAVAEGILDSWLVPRLAEIGKALFYKERDWEAILHIAARSGLPAMPLDKLARWVGSGRVEQKRLDSLEMIKAIRAHLSRGVEPLIVSYEFHNTGYHRAATHMMAAAFLK
jgi:hypothetical protein